MQEYLTYEKLGEILNTVYPEAKWSKTGKYEEPLYISYRYKISVLLENPSYYTNNLQLPVSHIREEIAVNNFGYKFVRLPYYVQLTPEVIKHLFGKDTDINLELKQGFINDNPDTVYPNQFSDVGIKAFIDRLETFYYIKWDIVRSLRDSGHIDPRLQFLITDLKEVERTGST